jgi:hypothetical protein
VLDERSIGSGKPGPITNRVIDAFRAHVKVSGLVID